MDVRRGVVGVHAVVIFRRMIAVVVEVVWVLLMGGLSLFPHHLWLKMPEK